jgi:hypothetical protein
MKKIKTLYPSILYDVYYYICLYEFEDVKAVNPYYYDIIRKQIKRQPIIDDEEILQKRKEKAWLYNEAELSKIIFPF